MNIKSKTRRVVGEAQSQAFEEFYKDLEINSGKHKYISFAKDRERKTRDLDQVKCIQDEQGKVLVTSQREMGELLL